MKPPALIIMAKAPVAGSTKTRLSPPMSHPQAANFYEALLKDTIFLASNLAGIQLAIAVTPPESISYFHSISPEDTILIPVEGIHIGDCLNQVINQLLESGHPKVVACDADSPNLPEQYICQAFSQLDHSDAVVGPCEDGGYYLIGLKSSQPSLFYDIEWSTPQVTAQTVQLARKNKITITTTPPWYDIDNISDVQRLVKELPALAPDRLPNTRQFLLTQENLPQQKLD